MDLSNIDDIKELKAMAYDQIAQREQAARNIDAINNRILELSQSVGQQSIRSKPDELANKNPEAI